MTSDSTLSGLSAADVEKRAAGVAGAQLVEDGMTVGLGTGSTVAYLLPALAARGLSVRCVATSPRTESAARNLGLRVETFGSIDRFDIAIDGADEVTPEGWLIKGGGAAHTREKIVAVTADRFVVIADSSKAVPALTWPVPVELMTFGLPSTLRRLGTAVLRDVPETPDGGVIADFHTDLADPARTAAMLGATPGVVAHGIFAPDLVHDVLVARGTEVEHRKLR
ncbi:ribose 5-phosphate isomerase A [Nakamurella deserti]|uniref:ribose 5-phosphate isomerase A n=1 Tax=Nakamurella deserti TaxID=2164074 RepID=UPI000DBE1F5F|nr:ribose 5-phosphate isomerase A [Nakamurella deserti]